jgi:hypothetical protein
MKLPKSLHPLPVALVLTLLLVILPVSPVMAASESIELQDSGSDEISEARIGDRIYVEGDYFDKSNSTDYYVDIYFSSEEADEGDEIDDEVEDYELVKDECWVDEDGEFRIYFYVPEELDDGEDDETVTSGTYYVYVTYHENDDIAALAELEIIRATLELDDSKAPVGTAVEITGADFNESADITIEFDGEVLEIESGNAQTDSDGEFECTVIIPAAVAGEHTIRVTDEDGSTGVTDFRVEPEITVSPVTTVDPGDILTVTGTGFGKYVDVDISIEGDWLNEGETDSYGSFQAYATVPSDIVTDSNYYLEVEDDDGNKVSTSIMVAAAATATPTPQSATPQPATAPPDGTGQEPSRTTSPATGMLWGLPTWAVYTGGAICLLVAFLIGFLLAQRSKS